MELWIGLAIGLAPGIVMVLTWWSIRPPRPRPLSSSQWCSPLSSGRHVPGVTERRQRR